MKRIVYSRPSLFLLLACHAALVQRHARLAPPPAKKTSADSSFSYPCSRDQMACGESKLCSLREIVRQWRSQGGFRSTCMYLESDPC